MEGVGLGAEAAALAYADFDESKLATWAPGEPVPFALLAGTLEQMAGTTKRLAKTHILVSAFRTVLATTPEDLLPFVYLCSNQARMQFLYDYLLLPAAHREPLQQPGAHAVLCTRICFYLLHHGLQVEE